MATLIHIERLILLTEQLAPKARKSKLWRRAAMAALEAATDADRKAWRYNEGAREGDPGGRRMPRSRGPSVWERFERHAHRTFEEAAARYLREFDGKDRRRQAYALESVLPYIGSLPLLDVDDEALEGFKEDRRRGQPPFSKPAMAGTINKELTLVVTVLNKACKYWRWIPSSPRIQHVKGAVRTAYPLTWEEQDRLFRRLPSGWDIGAALFAVNTGVRKSELFGLRWEHLVPIPELDTFVFILSDTKNGESRAVICNSLARLAVGYQRDNGSDYVFPSRAPGRDGRRIRHSGKVWIRAWEKAGLPTDPLIKRGIHNCRHTFAYRLRQAGVPQEDRNALLGHARTSLAEHYAMPDLKRLSAAAELVVERKDTVVLRAVKSSVETSKTPVRDPQ